MKWKKYCQILKRQKNEQLFFLDATIILEILFNQPRKEEWLDFLGMFRGRGKTGILSNFTLGEIVRNIYYFEEKFYERYDTELGMKTLNELIEGYRIEIETIDMGADKFAHQIMEYDTRIHFEDALNIGFAKSICCMFFCSIDSGISQATLHHFGLKKIEQNE
ncbi:MAG TPA: hypothetical protein VI977_06690 [archaeon]|nr:hypothetical protein [archaeon]